MAEPTAATKLKPRQLTRDGFVRRLRELLDEGLTHDELIEKLNPVRSMSVTAEYMLSAIESIVEALEVAHSVRNQAMQQAYADFVHFERRALEEAGAHAKHCAHISSAYPDEPIRKAKRAELDAGRDKYRLLADQAATDWQTIQRRRIPYDQSVQDYAEAFSDEERTPWKPKPVT